jgi:hypothetical protein
MQSREYIRRITDKLTKCSQDLLKEEWEKVKAEAEHGKLS